MSPRKAMGILASEHGARDREEDFAVCILIDHPATKPPRAWQNDGKKTAMRNGCFRLPPENRNRRRFRTNDCDCYGLVNSEMVIRWRGGRGSIWQRVHLSSPGWGWWIEYFSWLIAHTNDQQTMSFSCTLINADFNILYLRKTAVILFAAWSF